MYCSRTRSRSSIFATQTYVRATDVIIVSMTALGDFHTSHTHIHIQFVQGQTGRRRSTARCYRAIIRNQFGRRVACIKSQSYCTATDINTHTHTPTHHATLSGVCARDIDRIDARTHTQRKYDAGPPPFGAPKNRFDRIDMQCCTFNWISHTGDQVGEWRSVCDPTAFACACASARNWVVPPSFSGWRLRGRPLFVHRSLERLPARLDALRVNRTHTHPMILHNYFNLANLPLSRPVQCLRNTSAQYLTH